MRRIFTLAALIFVLQLSFAQSYIGIVENMQRSIKERKVLAAKLIYIDSDEEGEKRLTKYLYASNGSESWRAIHIPELQKTVFFDGRNKTHSFYHGVKKLEFHEGQMAIEAMKEYLDVVSSDLLVRKESRVNAPDSNIIKYIIAGNEGKVELVTFLPGDIGLGIKDKTIRYVIDTMKQLPVQMVDSTYFLERLVRRQEIVDTVYSSHHTIDSFYTLVQEWLESYSPLEDSIQNWEIARRFSFDSIYKSLTFINHPPALTNYVLLDFYYIGCVACLQCLPSIKKLINESRQGALSVVAINGYDSGEKIERFNRIYSVDYSSATISLSDLNSTIGHIAYPTYVLFDKDGTEIARASGCDLDFFEHIGGIISKP